jgi:hypothetical protein
VVATLMNVGKALLHGNANDAADMQKKQPEETLGAKL